MSARIVSSVMAQRLARKLRLSASLNYLIALISLQLEKYEHNANISEYRLHQYTLGASRFWVIHLFLEILSLGPFRSGLLTYLDILFSNDRSCKCLLVSCISDILRSNP